MLLGTGSARIYFDNVIATVFRVQHHITITSVWNDHDNELVFCS